MHIVLLRLCGLGRLLAVAAQNCHTAFALATLAVGDGHLHSGAAVITLIVGRPLGLLDDLIDRGQGIAQRLAGGYRQGQTGRQDQTTVHVRFHHEVFRCKSDMKRGDALNA